MRNGYLEYYQLILQKVSFDQRLFMKEYNKALKFLKQHEAESLHQWISSRGMQDLWGASISKEQGAVN